MDLIHGRPFNACVAGPIISQLPSEAQSRGKTHKEHYRKTLMDRVLVTPMKSGRRSSFRSGRPNLKPATPSRTLRHYSQRRSSGHSFAPYPKRSDAENIPPKTPSHKLRRTLSDHGCFNATAVRASCSPSRKALLSARRHLTTPPKRSSKRARRLSRSGPSLVKTQSDSSLNVSWWSNFNPLLSSSSAQHTEDGASAKNTVQDTDLELEFQALRLKDQYELATHGSTSRSLWPAISGLAQSKHPGPSLNSTASTVIPNSSGESVHQLVTHLRSALAEEIQARKELEKQYQQETQRRIEMEGLVAQLQREQGELSRQLSLVQLQLQPSLTSSSPVLLPSSPCTSSRTFVTTALLGRQ